MRVSSDDFGFGVLMGTLLGLVFGLIAGAAIEYWLFPKGFIYDYQSLIAALLAATLAFATIWQVRQQMQRQGQEVLRTTLARRRASRAMLSTSSIALRSMMKSISDEVWPRYNLMERNELQRDVWPPISEVPADGYILAVLKESIEWEDEDRNEILTGLLNAFNRTHYGVWAWNEKLFVESRVEPNPKKDLAIILASATEAYVRINSLLSGTIQPKLCFDDLFPFAHLLSRQLLDPNVHVHFIDYLKEHFGESQIYLKNDL